MKLLLVASMIVFLGACSSVTPINQTYVVDKGDCPVTVYQSKNAAEKIGEIEELCVIEGTSSASGAILYHRPEDAIRKHARKACECGADSFYIRSQAMSGMALASATMVAFKYVNGQPAKTETVDPYEAIKKKKNN
jgi:hypothetical protein